MRRLKKKIYLGLCATTVAVLAVVRYTGNVAPQPDVPAEVAPIQDTLAVSHQPSDVSPTPSTVSHQALIAKNMKHCIRGVHSYQDCFPDVQDVQIVAARKWGVKPVADRKQAEHRKQELVYVAANPYYTMDHSMSHSIPYLVPRAADLLETIGRNFLDSLYMKGVPFHTPIVTSILRSQSDLHRLRRINPNVSPESCHQFGTTFDIAYNRYHTVCPPGEHRREVRNDTLKYVLSEVLRDLRQEGRCYVKYEVKQACFHITTR